MNDDPVLALLDVGEIGAAVRGLPADDTDLPPDAPERSSRVITRAWARVAAGDLHAAEAALRPLLVPLDSHGDHPRLGHALLALGTAVVLGDAPAAGSALLDRALSELTSPWPRAQALRYLALALEKQGAAQAAVARYLDAAALYAALGHDFGNGNARYGAGAALIQLGRAEEAAAHLAAAVEILRRGEARPALGAALALLATITAPSDPAEALRQLAEATRLCVGGPEMYQLDLAARRAEVLLLLGAPAEALEALTDARARVPPGSDAVSLDHLAVEACLALGRDVAAQHLLDRTHPPGATDAVRFDRLALRLALAVRHGDEAGWEQSLDALERLARGHPRRRAAARILAATVPALATLHGESAVRAIQLAVRMGAPTEPLDAALGELRELGSRVPVGPIWLEARRGAGGMGEVWRGTHRDGTAVAVKLLRDEGDADQVDLFESEMQAVARLDHPHVVRVLAAVRLDPTAATLLGRRVGTPALVMEFASAGSLDTRLAGWDWAGIRHLLAGLLDALAHAHARDVLHLDLKPANVLLDQAEGGLVPRLGDFGLAGLARRNNRGQRYGTPAYMAPEQALPGADLDPRTDLYAFGCLAWHLLTGATVFSGGADQQILQHSRAPLPRFQPVVPVPAGTEDWLRCLLARRPADRFGCAADAHWGLSCLGSAPGGAPPVAPAPAENLTFRVEPSETLPLGRDRRPVGPAANAAPGRALPAAPFPADWRHTTLPTAPPFLVGAGDGLLAWRVGRFVGREAERDLLWRALDAVRRDGRGRCVWIRADRGVGRTALLRWVAETAHATGAAWVHRLRTQADGALLLPVEDTVAAVRLGRTDRPSLVVLDDADLADPLPLVRALAGLPALLVLTTTRPPPDPAEVETLRLEPLSEAEVGQVLDGLLPLDRALTARLVARSAGSPGFAVALLADLVRHDAVAPGPEGFRLVEEAAVDLPADLLGLWTARLDALAPAGDPARAAWEIAALLGPVAETATFDRACVAAGLGPAPTVLAPLEAEGWVSRDGDTLRFRAAPVREALVAAAVAGARAARWHAAIAGVLPATRGNEAVRGRHLAAAGRHAEALGLLRRGAADAVNATRVEECRELLALWERSADAIALPADDPRRGSPLVVRAHLALHTEEDPYGFLARGLGLVAGVEPETECQLTYTWGWILARDGRHAEAEARYRAAITLAAAHGLVILHAVAGMGLAASGFALGRDATAEIAAARAELVACLPDEVFRADAVAGRGLVRLGRTNTARATLLRALEGARGARAADVEAEVLTDLAGMDADRGDADGAIAWMDHAVAVLGPTGSDKALGATVHLAGLLACAGRDDQARAVLAPVRTRYGRRLRPEVAAELGWLEHTLDPDAPARPDLARARTDPWVARIAREAERRRGRGG